jgi:alginate O-acetyltransferase complex protein AlgI
VVCADNLATFITRHWSVREGNASSLLLAAACFSCQIFADLAGYTSMARGLGYWLGYRLPENFDYPYLARTFSDFWQRWHITLSRWLRDYLFLPISYATVRALGRVQALERFEVLGAYVAGALGTMLLGGLWHGAGFPFLVWGLLHGLGLAVERVLGLHRSSRKSWRRKLRTPWFLLVQATVVVAWIFFRSPSVWIAAAILRRIATGPFLALPGDGWMATLFALPVLGVHLYGLLRERKWAGPIGPYGKAILAGGMILLLLTCYGNNNAFIYFQF